MGSSKSRPRPSPLLEVWEGGRKSPNVGGTSYAEQMKHILDEGDLLAAVVKMRGGRIAVLSLDPHGRMLAMADALEGAAENLRRAHREPTH